MKTLKVRDIIIGEGIPKIAVSITGTSNEEIESQAKSIDPNIVDILEWRADFYEDVFQIKNVLEVLKKLRNIMKNMPIIFTFRTREEGGEKDIDKDYYSLLNKSIAESGNADIIDIQIFLDKTVVKETILYIHKKEIAVIGSYHDFKLTPEKDSIINLALLCESLGSDIIKLAFMPNTIEDVIDLMYATNNISNNIDKPIITMAMGKLGLITRISGDLFGSSVTFACQGKESAPGQISVESLYNILRLIS